MAKKKKTKKQKTQIKLTCMLPTVKKTTLKEKSKVRTKGDSLAFVAKNGNKMTCPLGAVILRTEKFVQFELPMRKIVKGSFKLDEDEGIWEDTKAKMMVPSKYVVSSEEIAVK